MGKRYRVKARCKACRHRWTTKKKKNARAPHQCPRCGSTRTKTITAWTVK